MEKREFVSQLLAKLYKQGKSKEFIAYKLGVDSNTVWRWAQGKSAPHRLFVREMEKMLDEKAEGLKSA